MNLWSIIVVSMFDVQCYDLNLIRHYALIIESNNQTVGQV